MSGNSSMLIPRVLAKEIMAHLFLLQPEKRMKKDSIIGVLLF
jgi:hypothetical protein